MNHSRRDYYQPGADFFRDTDLVFTGAGDFNEVTTGAWTALTRRLYISYKPLVDSTALLIGQVSCSHSVDNEPVRFRIRDGGAGAIAVTSYAPMGPNTDERTCLMVALVELTRDVTYNWEVFYYMPAATLTIIEAASYTYLQMKVARVP